MKNRESTLLSRDSESPISGTDVGPEVAKVLDVKTSPALLQKEAEIAPQVRLAMSQAEGFNPSEPAQALRSLEEGADRHVPFTDRAVEDVLFGTVIPGIRKSVAFQDRFRQSVMDEIAERGDRYVFASPQVMQAMMGTTNLNEPTALANVVNILGLYEGQRRTARVGIWQQKREELLGQVESLHQGIDAAMASGVLNPTEATKVLADIDAKQVAAMGPSYLAGMSSRNVLTSLLAEQAVKNWASIDGRNQIATNLKGLHKRYLGEVQRSLSAGGAAFSAGMRNTDNLWAALSSPVTTDQAVALKARDPQTARLIQLIRATVGDTEAANQVISLLNSPNVSKAAQEAAKAGKVSPPEVYGTAVGVLELLQFALSQSESYTAQGIAPPGGKPLTRPDFMSLAGKLYPIITDQYLSSHVQNAAAIQTVQNGLTGAPKPVRDATDDAEGDSLADLSWLVTLGQAHEAIQPAVSKLMDSLPGGGSVMATKALAHTRASLARRWGALEQFGKAFEQSQATGSSLVPAAGTEELQ